MPTAYPDIFAALCQPFPSNEVKTRTISGRREDYITARIAMNRLDKVLGPENWRDSYFETEKGLKCRIEYRLAPDGEWLWKEDGGASAGMPDADNDEKSGYSDAFKRACVKLGVARYLYKDGTPFYETNGSTPAPVDNVHTPTPAPAQAQPTNRAAPAINGIPIGFEPDGSIRKPNSGKGMFACCMEQKDKHSAEFVKPVNEWAKSQGMANRMTEWDDDAVEKGWRYLCYLVAKHTGTLASAPQAAPTPAVNGDLTGLRRSIVARAGEIHSMVNRVAPTDDQIATKLRSLWNDLGFGDMGLFGKIADSGRLAELKSTLDAEFEEVNDIPF